MRKLLLRAVALCVGASPLPGVGCAKVDPRPDFERFNRHLEAAVGHASEYRLDLEGTRHAEVAQLLEGGLTADEAVRVALLNNPQILAGLARIGMARADLVQAGLFSNPTLGISLRFPDGGGLADLEAGLAQNIADLWMIPARTRAAERDLDRTILDVARAAAVIASDTKVAYLNAVAAQRALEISCENLDLVRQLLNLAQARFEAGTIGALDVGLVRGLLLRAEVEERTARLAGTSAKRMLATQLGVDAPRDEIQLLDSLPDPRDLTLDQDRLVEVARDNRLDLRAARDAVSAAEARLELEYARVFQNVEVGVALEREARRAPAGRKLAADTARASLAAGSLTAPEIESRGARRLARSEQIEAILGPSLSLTLPLFDHNQAQIAKAGLAVQETSALHAALDLTVAQETRAAADRALGASQIARSYEAEILPQAQATLELTRSAYQAGQTPILNVIDAQRSLLEARQSYTAAVQSAGIALIDLERATARPAAFLLQLNVRATESAQQPSSDSVSKEISP